ncbi:hypothetical protein TNCV_2182061 [Trichonephila clavipes]|uniref:Uncharacterized protein n=1 Tax=Trichonephila clavipes TaxID=2585209 RepID=A0A8X6VV28_TRICX|nr:hypothetical protein TNCV_2182061 [Trichonephila clavipes]
MSSTPAPLKIRRVRERCSSVILANDSLDHGLKLRGPSPSFCASYKDATLYEASATFATPPEIKSGSFAQFVHDNADFNINTMEFHDLHKSGEVFKNANEASQIIYFKRV